MLALQPGSEAKELRPPPPIPTLRALYDANAAYVVRCLRYLGVREAELDDATQETFLIANRKLSDLRDPAGQRSWLYAIALNIARHARRKRSSLSLDAAPEPSTTAPARVVEARSELLSVLAVLDDERRELVVLYHLEQLTLEEISAATGVPLQTIYSRLKSATKLMTSARGGAEENA